MKKIHFLNDKSKPAWHGIPRDEINWSPIIDLEKCIGCGLCVLECPTHVFRFDFNRHIAEVIKSSKCKVGCTTCVNLCLAKAIKLPSLQELYELMKERNVMGLSWENLDDNKYMWM
jgi:CDP-4-dehydro-6-deoxyglucose reductase